MPATEVQIPTADGTCNASLHTPASGVPAPAVIMFPDAGGRRPTFDAMGERLAGLGFVALVPDVYYRTEWAPFSMETVFTNADERTRLFTLMRSLTPDMAIRDTGSYLDFLAGRPEVRGSKVGTTGYCMGGRLSLTMAGHHADRIGAAMSFHGGNIAAENDPASPHLLADRVTAHVYVGGSINDATYPDEQRERLAQAYAAAGVDATFDTYQALHGFAVPDNPPYDEAEAERHWRAMASFFAAHLA